MKDTKKKKIILGVSATLIVAGIIGLVWWLCFNGTALSTVFAENQRDLGEIDARNEENVKDAVLKKTFEPELKAEQKKKEKFTIILDTDATKNQAKVKHEDFTGEVEVKFTVRTAPAASTKQDLSTFTKTPTDQAITVTQAESTTPTQDTLNKFLKQDGSLTVNTDATIKFDTTNKKATITAAPNSTQAKGNVVFTNVTTQQ
ncbi:hypothetical protein [Candidatus Phytoplasma solani]|uniref:Uncharacterized protein n=1 Tax=Candidatus Phytoplasma solani TaxID=69896 RepID=A0A421NUU7_9MOLU|nr:hypothetical protein [Candidatus Phytoplasma solani]RMI87799.1 hypothetical protein PSSA1_v1c5680 [Candidatus Phytoplasma solani]